MIADMLCNKKLNPIEIEIFVGSKKRNVSLVFNIQFYFAVPKSIRLNSTHYFITKIQNNQKLQQTVFHQLSDIDFRDFMNL